MSPSKYVNKSGKKCAEYVKENYNDKFVLPKTAPNPFPIGYEPETDVSTALVPEYASYFRL